MEYKVTFADGSGAALVHFGVKGMKWGVWNQETAARRNGKPSVAKARAKYFTKETLATAGQIGTGIAAGVGTTLATGNPLAGRLVGAGVTGGLVGASYGKEMTWKKNYHYEMAEAYRTKAVEKGKAKYNELAAKQQAKGDDTAEFLKLYYGDGKNAKK